MKYFLILLLLLSLASCDSLSRRIDEGRCIRLYDEQVYKVLSTNSGTVRLEKISDSSHKEISVLEKNWVYAPCLSK